MRDHCEDGEKLSSDMWFQKSQDNEAPFTKKVLTVTVNRNQFLLC